jgi:hypothetical protein
VPRRGGLRRFLQERRAVGRHRHGQTTQLADGSAIQGTMSFTRTDGSTGTAATVSFASDDASNIVRTTKTLDTDGCRRMTTATATFNDNHLVRRFAA